MANLKVLYKVYNKELKIYAIVDFWNETSKTMHLNALKPTRMLWHFEESCLELPRIQAHSCYYTQSNGLQLMVVLLCRVWAYELTTAVLLRSGTWVILCVMLVPLQQSLLVLRWLSVWCSYSSQFLSVWPLKSAEGEYHTACVAYKLHEISARLVY